MNLMLDDSRKMAVAYDYVAADWYMYSGQVPDSYGIEFQPAISADDLSTLSASRVVNYELRTVYEMVPFGTGYTTEPRDVYFQQLIPMQENSA
jgi:GDP-D-mannose dehydratase